MVKATVLITKELSVKALNEVLVAFQTQYPNIEIISVSQVRTSGFFVTQHEYVVAYKELGETK